MINAENKYIVVIIFNCGEQPDKIGTIQCLIDILGNQVKMSGEPGRLINVCRQHKEKSNNWKAAQRLDFLKQKQQYHETQAMGWLQIADLKNCVCTDIKGRKLNISDVPSHICTMHTHTRTVHMHINIRAHHTHLSTATGKKLQGTALLLHVPAFSLARDLPRRNSGEGTMCCCQLAAVVLLATALASCFRDSLEYSFPLLASRIDCDTDCQRRLD